METQRYPPLSYQEDTTMKIDLDHMYHGAALIQVAEDERFTSINAFHRRGALVNGAYKINEDTILVLKYASEPNGSFEEYQFGFSKKNVTDLFHIRKDNEKIFFGLVCVKDREICCLPYELFRNLIKLRREAVGSREDNYTIKVVLAAQKRMRVYINFPRSPGNAIGDPIILPRSAFPSTIFEI